MWTPTYGCAKAGRPARTYIQQLCEDTGCNSEDLPEAMNDREKWRERVGGCPCWRHDMMMMMYIWVIMSLLWREILVTVSLSWIERCQWLLFFVVFFFIGGGCPEETDVSDCFFVTNWERSVIFLSVYQSILVCSYISIVTSFFFTCI